MCCILLQLNHSEYPIATRPNVINLTADALMFGNYWTDRDESFDAAQCNTVASMHLLRLEHTNALVWSSALVYLCIYICVH